MRCKIFKAKQKVEIVGEDLNIFKFFLSKFLFKNYGKN